MKTATPTTRQQGFEVSPFEVPSFRRRSMPTYSGESPELSPFARQRIQPELGITGFDPFSGSHWQRFKADESPLPPALVFANALRFLSASQPLRISQGLSRQIIELSQLKSGWDGESAIAPRPEALAHTVGLILLLQTALPEFEEPFVVPTIGGFTQLEWNRGHRALEFEATANGWSVVGSETKPSGERIYHEADTARFDVDKLLAAYRWFAGQELLWPII
jgi:hypothetical protein